MNEPSPSLVQPGSDMPVGAVTTLPSFILTLAEFAGAIADRERALRDGRVPGRPARRRPGGRALMQASIAALRSSAEPLPRIPSMRIVRGWSPNGTPLPEDWSVLIEPDETPLAFAPLPVPYVGYIAAVARTAELPKPALNGGVRRRPLSDTRFRVVPFYSYRQPETSRERPANDRELDEHASLLSLVDELAVFAADLWFAGKLDRFLTEEPDDAGDE